jgi:nitrogen-specific signal transduction histidine kinase
MKLRANIFTLSLFFALLLYLIDALIDSLIFHTGTFWSSLFSGVPAHEIRLRMVMVAGFVAFGIVVSRILAGRRRAEGALLEAHERAIWLARFPEENPNPVVRVSDEGKVLYQNSAAAKLPGWGCTAGEHLSDALLSTVGKAMTDRQETHQDVELGGRVYSVSVTPFPGESYANVYGRDITEHKWAEEALAERTAQLERTNRELVTANAELEDFTHVASHDLQEPLRTLTAFSDLLRQDLDRSLPAKAEQDLGFITDAARRMQRLIQDLLALSRAGRAAKKREKVLLGECVDRALEALTVRVNETGAQVSRDELPEVWGDSTLLTQLYQNLIGNALKFRGDQPPAIRLTVEERDGSPVFGVKDNGIGIESRYTQQIFQPFRRLHGRAEYEGSGIGLAICRKIVERHGGKIWVESEAGKGAHFLFTISHRRREG